MSKNLLRRDVLAFGGGSVAGLLLTPVPWRLITDTALWSQNWSWIPKLGRGEIRTRYTHCPLCPAGCAAKVRCLEDQPLSLAGFAGDGALCRFGLTVHHLPYHPARLLETLGHGNPISGDEAAKQIGAAIAKRAAGERVAMLDLRPGRTTSWMYRMALAAVPDALYLTPSSAPANGVDLDRVQTILSFGVPVLDGWGSPGRVLARRDRFRLIQVEAAESRSVLLADLWLPARPGTENALVQALLGAATAARAASAMGLDAKSVEAAARMLAENGPALVLGDIAGAAALHAKFAAPLTSLREVPVPKEWSTAVPATALADAPDRSIRVLFIDESIPGDALPWSLIDRKLVPENRVIVTFACSRQGYARHADFALPAPVPGETVHEMTGSAASAASSYRIAGVLAPPPKGMVDPAAFLAAACGATLPEKAVEQRARAIHQAGRGQLVAYGTGAATPVKDVKFDDFYKTLNEGGRWEDDVSAIAANAAAPQPSPPALPPPVDADLPLTVVVADAERGPATPLMTKVYHESGLRQGSNQARLHPETARANGLEDGARAQLQTLCGRCDVRVKVDPGMMPGVVGMVEGPLMIDLCRGRSARAKVVRL